ncbi:hypothetical protein CspeluHIS016_0700420 [Cutaneotrichosporon spelunceum]|uniref:Calpain catalytic domain-containing protein n=1 Tax=Cutaneotrichosporon spelunceum TaxID=1672016 RepID=A0AAD3TY40_9TREE|nr:hypothetical protein CspeluHIS016_0700420 [Cutaneotrichosporon spelunceum]
MKLVLLAVLAALAAAAPAISNGDRIAKDLVARNNWGGSDDGAKYDDGHEYHHNGEHGEWNGKGGKGGHGWKGDEDGHSDNGDHSDNGEGEGGTICLARRHGSPGMGSYYSKGWDDDDSSKWTKHGDTDKDNGKGHGHGDGHDGHGGHGGNHGDCPDPNSQEDTTKWIINNPTVVVNETLPLHDIDMPMIEIIDEGLVPTLNRTAPILGEGDLPALLNDSNPATLWGGVASPGMNSTFRPEQGTNKNTDAFGSGSSNSNVPRSPGDCTYEYRYVLGGDGSASSGSLWALEGFVDLVAADVQQGGIGDCGMGAAVMALASGGWTSLIKKSFVRVGEGEGSYEVLLKKDGVTQRIAIDDQLPFLTGAAPGSSCWPYPGFQPVLDAALPGPNGNYPPTPIFFMPLFEKAFAKFLDANPDWKAAKPEETGYAGLEGVNPAYVLAAITGGKPVSVPRTTPGLDGPIIAALLRCMTGSAPCAISTGNSTTLEGLGPVDASNVIWLNPTANGAAGPSGYNPGETSGMLASDKPGSKSTFTIIDFDQVRKTPEGDRSTVVTFVGNHAYAFDRSRSTTFPFPASITSLLDIRMTVLNPWGANPCQWPGGGCGTGGSYYEPAALPFSFRTLAMSIIGVYTVEDMPGSV